MNNDPFEDQLENTRVERDSASVDEQSDDSKSQNKHPAETGSDHVQSKPSDSTISADMGLQGGSDGVDSDFPFVKLSLGSIIVYFGVLRSSISVCSRFYGCLC